MIPYLTDTHVYVGLAGSDHLIGYLHKQRGHTFGSVVVGGNGVDHSDGVHKARNVLHHYSLCAYCICIVMCIPIEYMYTMCVNVYWVIIKYLFVTCEYVLNIFKYI